MADAQLMHYPKRLMNIAGAWQLPQFKSSMRQKLYHFVGYMLQIFFLTGCLSMLLDLYFTMMNSDIRKLAENFVVTSSCVLGLAKIYVFQNATFTKFIKIIIKEERKISGSDDEVIRNLHSTSAEYVSKISNFLRVACVITAIFLCLSTYVVGLLRSHDPLVEKPVIMRISLPFDQNKYYGWSLLPQTIWIFQATIYNSASQSLYITMMTFAKLQFLILQHRINQGRSLSGDDTDVMKRLIRCHQRLIRFVAELNEAIKFLILLEFLLSSSLIATAAFQFIEGKHMRDYCFSVFCVIILTLQVFILVWHADAVSVESVNVANAFYNSQWYEKSIEVQKMMYMAIMRAQKPSTITIGPFKPLTNPIIAQVINTAYSFITLMTRNY